MTTLNLAPLLPGELLGDAYVVESILGRGGMGVVLAARHLVGGHRVAVKFLCTEAAPKGAVERFFREARAAAMVENEHVCRVLEVGRIESGEPYLVMEYLEGIDFAEKLEIEGPQDVTDTCATLVDVCEALAEAHARGIVHRDLKPANIFLHTRSDGSRTAKVLDFGISKLPSLGALTRSAMIMGSPLYMSPEQLASTRDVDARADIWSLGIVLHELLTGTAPFVGPSMVQLANQVRQKHPPLVSEARTDVPKALARVVERCLAKMPSDRFPSAAALGKALAPFSGRSKPPVVMGALSALFRKFDFDTAL